MGFRWPPTAGRDHSPYPLPETGTELPQHSLPASGRGLGVRSSCRVEAAIMTVDSFLGGSSVAAENLVVAMTGASGAPYGLRLLEVLLRAGRTVHLVMSPAAA